MPKYEGQKLFNHDEKKKKLWNKKVTVIPILVSALGTISKGFAQGLEDSEIGRQVDSIHH